jgi:hypothetical protein
VSPLAESDDPVTGLAVACSTANHALGRVARQCAVPMIVVGGERASDGLLRFGLGAEVASPLLDHGVLVETGIRLDYQLRS